MVRATSSAVILAVSLLLCLASGSSHKHTEKPEAPGLYGWPGYAVYGDASVGNVLSGTVGLPFNAPTYAHCVGGSWSANAEMATGALPPGLQMSGNGTISGVPELAGDWNFTVRFFNTTCNDGSYAASITTVRILVTGSSAP